MPNSAASTTMCSSRLVHCRAATAGAITIAAIRTTPTICRPTTTASAMVSGQDRLEHGHRQADRGGEDRIEGDQLELLPERRRPGPGPRA